jgi:hypothetical protein
VGLRVFLCIGGWLGVVRDAVSEVDAQDCDRLRPWRSQDECFVEDCGLFGDAWIIAAAEAARGESGVTE